MAMARDPPNCWQALRAWPGWQWAWLVALRGPGRPGSHIRCRPLCWAWLSNDVPACRGLAVAWLKRGARAPVLSLELGVPATVFIPRAAEGDASHGGGDDRGGSPQGLTHGGGDQRR